MTVEKGQVREQRLRRCKEAAARWEARSTRRQVVRGKLRAREDADEPERILEYFQREAQRPGTGPDLRVLVRRALETPGTPTERVRFLERRIGPTLDWSANPSGAGAEAAGRSVGRICLSPDPRDEVGFATGFLVSPSLLLTNHHVFQERRDAEGTFVQFGYEVRGGSVQSGTFFELAPELFFTSNGDLDYALVGVRPTSVDGARQLGQLTPHRLIAQTGKILIGHRISIIQHPDGGTKRYAERENQLLDVLEDFLQYTTDTSPGSSGSPCFNVAWEVVALHHSGVPRMENGRILTAEGTPWDESMSESEIAWVANEGVRVSRLLAELSKTHWEAAEQARLDELLEGRATALPVRAPRTTPMSPPADGAPSELVSSTVAEETRVATVIHVQGDATFYVACPAPAAGAPLVANGDALPSALEKKLRFDPDYSARTGYAPDFLEVEIPLPGVTAARRAELVKRAGNQVLVLDYHHFSLAMNRERRLQMWSAVNVDYSKGARRHASNREAFGTDTWVLDPRLPANLQIQDAEFYAPATGIDRGHMVRRDDNCWGLTFGETEFANSDTFHWTNCTPQHERFNQSRLAGLWGRLEDVVKQRAGDTDGRMSIFAGPVLADDDPEAYGLQYPVKFWKVVAAIVDGELEAYGFVLDQTPIIDRYGLEELDFGKLRVHQVSLTDIEALTDVVFPAVLRAADVRLGNEAIAIDRLESVRHRSGVPAR